MFVADVSWSDGRTETVGQRRERKAKERDTSRIASISSSNRSNTSFEFRPFSRKVAKQTTSMSNLREVTGPPKTASIPVTASTLQPPDFDIDSQKVLRTPGLFHRPPEELKQDVRPPPKDINPPRLPGYHGWLRHPRSSSKSVSSRRPSTVSSLHSEASRSVAEVVEIQQISPGSFISRSTTTCTEIRTSNDSFFTPSSSPSSIDLHDKFEKPSTHVEIQSLITPEPQATDYAPLPSLSMRNITKSLPPLEPPKAPSESWSAPSDWDCAKPKTFEVTVDPLSPLQSPTTPRQSSYDNNSEGMTHFQRFIRRMDSAGPKIILDRLNEEWMPEDPEEKESTQFEKRLWILTALQLRKLSHAQQPSPSLEADVLHKRNSGGKQKRILELYGNLAEVYQLSAMNPRDKLRYLSTNPQGSVPLPSNVSYLTVPIPGITPFPYPAASFDRIRSSDLPSVISLTKLPSVLQECSRLLAPGGVLEMRIISPAPDRDSMGPKLRDWIDDRLLLNLEQSFRCLRPAVLMPKWIEGAGLTVMKPSQTLHLPAVHNPSITNVSDELAARVSQAMWLDVWGEHLQDQPGQPRVWWEIPELVAEALAHGTTIDCTTILARKSSIHDLKLMTVVY